MPIHDYVIDDATGANFRADINSVLQAIVSSNSSATEPTTAYAYMWWADTTTGKLKIRNSANNGWVTVGTLASANLGHALITGDTFTGEIAVPSINLNGVQRTTWPASSGASANIDDVLTNGNTTAQAVTFGNVIAPLFIGGITTSESIVYKTTTANALTGSDHVFVSGNNGAQESLRLYNSGIINMKNQTLVSFGMNANLTGISTSFIALGTCITTGDFVPTRHGGDWNSTDGIYTATETGYYVVSVSGLFTPPTTLISGDLSYDIALFTGTAGSPTRSFEMEARIVTLGNVNLNGVFPAVLINAGDVIQLKVRVNAAITGTATLLGGTANFKDGGFVASITKV